MSQWLQYVGTFGSGQQAHSSPGVLQQVLPSAQATESLQGTAATERQTGTFQSEYMRAKLHLGMFESCIIVRLVRESL